MMPHPRPSWPRRLRRVCVFVLLGLGTTVGVTWAIGSRANEYGVRVAESHQRPAWLFETAPHWPDRAVGSFRVARLSYDALSVANDDGDLFTAVGYVHRFHQRLLRAGLPLRCLSYRASLAELRGEEPVYDEGLTLIDRGIWLGRDGERALRDARLPLRPIWPGLAFDTAFYALLWWLAFASVQMVKRDRRYRRGLCPVCRYDLRADYSQGCSECGWGRA